MTMKRYILPTVLASLLATGVCYAAAKASSEEITLAANDRPSTAEPVSVMAVWSAVRRNSSWAAIAARRRASASRG